MLAEITSALVSQSRRAREVGACQVRRREPGAWGEGLDLLARAISHDPFLLLNALPQNSLGIAKEGGWLHTNGRASRASLDAGLIIIACAQIALDRQLLAHFPIGIARALCI